MAPLETLLIPVHANVMQVGAHALMHAGTEAQMG